METNTLSLQRLTYFFVLIFLAVYFLIAAQSILVPLAFGALFAFMLKPVCAFFERWVKWRILAISLSMLAAAIPITGVTMFFSTQLVNVVQDMPSIKEKLNAGAATVYGWAKEIFNLSQAETDQFLTEQVPKLLDAPLSFLGVGVSSSTTFFTGFLLSIIYIFLFLLYRSAFKGFMLVQTGKKQREKVNELLDKIQSVIQKYLYGLLLVILIMGVMNSIGLALIGIRYAVFWGFLAATLAIIPYIGTFIGGFLPFLYALATAGQSWQPIAVVGLFMFVQAMEGNFITPNIVGSTVKVNPLAAIVALLAGAQIWGIAGMVLSLPSTAVLKEVLKQSDTWKPVGFLLSDEIAESHGAIQRRWDKEQFRLRSFFNRK